MAEGEISELHVGLKGTMNALFLKDLALKTRRDLAECSRKLDGLVDAIAGGLRSPTLQAKLEELEAQKAGLVAEINAAPPPAPHLHPNLAELYRRRVAELANALSDPTLRDEALQLLRDLIEQVSITPEGKAFRVEFIGQIANMLALSSPKDAGQMARHEIAVKGVAGARYPLYRKVLWLRRSYPAAG